MPNNVTGHACFDSTGLIWIGTFDVLIGYDGSRMHQYQIETHPGLPPAIEYLYCDSHNRVWICSAEGLSLLDEHRRIKKIVISDTLSNKDVNECVEVPGVGMVAFGPGKTFLLPENKTVWQPYTWFDQSVLKGKGLMKIRRFDKTSCMFIAGKKAMLVDFAAQKIITEVAIPDATSICKLSSSELLVITADQFDMYRINIPSGAITKKYTAIKDMNGVPIETATVSCDRGSNGLIYITTRSAGLISFDPVTEQIRTYQHQALNKASISSNNLRRVHCNSNGYMIITSTTGLNYTNIETPVLDQQNKFVDQTGTVTDNIIMAAEDAKGRIWLSNVSDLLILDPKTNKARNISPPKEIISRGNPNTEAAGICNDQSGNMWVSYNGKGLAKFSVDGKLLLFLTHEKKQVPTNHIRIIRLMQNNSLAVGAEDGFFLLDPATLAVDTFVNDPALKAIARKRVIDIMPDGDELWLALSPRGGAYCYNFRTKKLRTITEKEGLSSSRVYTISKDRYKNIYIGTYKGLNILDTMGRIRIIDKRNGLRNTRVDNIVTDNRGRLWITNFHTLICYDPADSSFAYFDEQNGVRNAGFTVGQGILTHDGNIIFCNNGLLIVNTNIPLPRKQLYPRVSINRIYDDGGFDLLDPSVPVKLDYDNGKISFYYLANNLFATSRFFYRYKMDNVDTGWQQATKNNQVTYNLNPGKYVFHIQTSYIESDWQDADNKIFIIVSPPWWQKWWFRIIVIAFVGAIVFFLFRRRIAAIRTKASIRQQMAELEGKALRAQMNPHFIFNSLNAIQELIVTENYNASYQYLSKFSKLLRLVLNNSEKNFIPLSDEIEMNRLYLELESLRFKQSFHYTINTDEHTDTETTMFPSLLLQPFIENAIWHGLMHKEGDKKLSISFSTDNDIMSCVIEDNGIGREKAAGIKAQKLGSHHFASKGTELAQQRVQVLRQTGLTATSIETKDILDTDGSVKGTRVEIKIPLNKTVNPSS